MGIKKSLIILAVVVLASSYAGARAESISNSCRNELMTMSSCLSYITGNSSTPAPSCCSALSNVVQSQPRCLCAAVDSGAASSLGIAINQTRALDLPSVCNVQTSHVGSCNGSEIPANFPSGSGSKIVPSTEGSISKGSITRSSLDLLAFIVSITIVSCTSVMAMF